jgi:hypothetical protein
MRPGLLAVLLALLTGCTTIYDLSGSDWTKPDTIIQQTTQDEMECVREAREAGWTPDLIVGGVVDAVRIGIEESQRRSAYQRCMLARGYQPS